MQKTNLCKLALSLFLFSTASFADPLFSQNFEVLIKQHELPGAVVLIKRGDATIHHQAYGAVNCEHVSEMWKDAIFRIPTVSEPITAFALLQLVDQGKVSLDDDIRKHLPDFALFEHEGKPQLVTLRQLLSHTAGFGYGGGIQNWIDIRYLLANPLSRRKSLREMVGDLSGIELKFGPGQRIEYSMASDVQVALIEAVTRMPLDAYLQMIGMMQVEDGWMASDRWMSTEVHDLPKRQASASSRAVASQLRTSDDRSAL
ncbi:serine hydrolase domain-containing protein [Roseateles sp.]|uniref:serine hydrolase domain-containing protein n=1 Tax=Roseateles sp. TaxID=1971397 RepID=UPI003D1176A3